MSHDYYDDEPVSGNEGKDMTPTFNMTRRDPYLTSQSWHEESHVHPDGTPSATLLPQVRINCPWCA